MEPHFYPVEIKWESQRKGTLRSIDVNNSFEVATPPQFPGGMPGIWSPEHLLTAAVASCYMTTFLSIAEKSRLNYSSFSCKGNGKLEMSDGVLLMTEIVLYAELQIADAADKDKAEKILEKAEIHCLISNSIKSKVSLNTSITF
ncbi:MAG: OsmC family protein [Bacteroidota bacterium]